MSDYEYYEYIHHLNELNDLNDNHLKTCLKVYKPHFEIEQFQVICKPFERDEDQEYEHQERDYITKKNKMRYVKIFDKVQALKKLLVIFQSNLVFDYEISIFNDVLKSFVRDDLILNLYDSYFLDSESIFYVFEIECYDLTSEILSDKYNISKSQIEQISQKQLNYIFKLLGIKDQNNLTVPATYVNLQNSSQIQIKLNLFDFFEQIKCLAEKMSYQNRELLYDKVQQEQEKQEKKILPEIQIEDNLTKILNEKLSDYVENALQQLSKEKCLEKIQSMDTKNNESQLAFIYEIISQHPLYNNFGILSIKDNQFELRLNKADKGILLVGIKFDTVKKAQTVENEYKKFHKLSGKLKSNLIETYVLELGNCALLLLEYDQQSYNMNQLSSISNIFEIENIYSGKYNNKEVFCFLKLLIDISYELWSQYNIRITDIDPDKILFESEQILLGINSFLFDANILSDFFTKYTGIVDKCISMFKSIYQDSFYSFIYCRAQEVHINIVLSFLKMISNSSIEDKENIQKQYKKIFIILGLISKSIESQQSDKYARLKISHQNPFKLVIDFCSFYYMEQYENLIQQIKNCFVILEENQDFINQIELKTNYNFSKIQKYLALQNQSAQKNLSQNQFSSTSKFQNQNHAQNVSSLLPDQDILQEIGFSSTFGYNNYNIGLALCQHFKNIQILNLEFSEKFNFDAVNENSNFLRLSEQIIGLQLNFYSKKNKIIDLVKQLDQYKNLNSLNIKICKTFDQKLKLKQIINKMKWLVLSQIYEGFSFTNNKIDDDLGFFF
ncbi:hypothetical protein ABPG73_021906 [Tetrahymena malaccensis]